MIIAMERLLTLGVIVTTMLLLRGGSLAMAEGPAVVFPGKTWETRTPAEVGIDEAKLAEFIASLGPTTDLGGDPTTRPTEIHRMDATGLGCVIRDGYLVRGWGDPNVKFNWYSASKPVLTTLLFLAIQDGKVKSVDQPIVDFGWGLTGKDRGITFRHLADMTSGYACIEGPGQAYSYNDVAIQLYHATLKKIFNCESLNAVVPQYLAPLQFEKAELFGRPHRGGGVVTTPRDFARIGWFWLNRGNWNGKQLLARQFFDEYMKPDVPTDMPRGKRKNKEYTENDDYLKVGSFGGGINQGAQIPGAYGFNWWFNGPAGEDRKLALPDAPLDIVMARGFGGNVMVVLPSHGVVVAARGDWGEYAPGDPNAKLNQRIKMLMSAIKGRPADSSAPSR